MAPSLEHEQGRGPQNGVTDGEDSEEPLEPTDTTISHMSTLSEFVGQLNKASEKILKLDRIYDRVAALVTYWSGPQNLTDRPYLKAHGSNLWEVFKESFRFEAGESPFELPGNSDFGAFRNLQKKIDEIVYDGGISSKKQRNLFILYYGGHATADNRMAGDLLWMPKVKSSMSINWRSVQDLLAEANCDLLFLFDCCYGGSMINPKTPWRGRCDLLASCPPSSDASGREQESFTWALVKELDKELKRHKRCDVHMLHNNLNSEESKKTYNLTRDPIYLTYSRRAGLPIYLHPLRGPSDGSEHQPESTQDLLNLSKARVLFKVSFANPQYQPVLKEWEDFLRYRPGNITQMTAMAYDSRRPPTLEEVVLGLTSLHGLFETHSNVAIMSIPVWLWDLLPRHPAVEYITIVRSENLVENVHQTLRNKTPEKVPTSAISPAPRTASQPRREKKPASRPKIQARISLTPVVNEEWYIRMIKTGPAMEQVPSLVTRSLPSVTPRRNWSRFLLAQSLPLPGKASGTIA